MVTACQLRELLFFRKVQKAVGPPELSQTDPPVNARGVQGRPRGPKVAAVTLVSVGVTGVVAGRSWLLRLSVFGALATGCWTTSEVNVTTGSPGFPVTTEVPPFPDAPVRTFGSMSTYASCGALPEAARM